MITRLEKNKKIQDKIIKEENKKRFLKISKILSITLGIILLILCLGMFVGAKVVLVKEYRIEKNNIPSSFHGIKIVQISDLLYNSFSKNDLDKITKQVNELEPDILIFTGDIKRKDYKLSKKDIELLEYFFKNINASIKKYAVTGDLDDDSFNLIMENSNFILLNNEIDYKKLCKKWYKKPSLKLLFSKYIWGNRQKIWLWNLKNKWGGNRNE